MGEGGPFGRGRRRVPGCAHRIAEPPGRLLPVVGVRRSLHQAGRTAGRRSGPAAYSGLGGSVPLRLVSEAAEAMARGELDLALVVGGEALATRRHLPDPPWSSPPAEARPFPLTLDRQEAANGIYQAYLTFALLDTARRAHLGRSPADHHDHLGRLLAPMTEVAASQPEHAWFPTARDGDGDHDPLAGEPDGGHALHQAHDGDHGRRHGGRGAAGHRGASRRAGRGPRQSGSTSGARGVRGALHHGGEAGACGGRRPWRRPWPQPSGRPPSTTWATSTSTPALPAPLRSPVTPSASARTTVASPSPAASPTTAVRAATTTPTRWQPWPRPSAATRAHWA